MNTHFSGSITCWSPTFTLQTLSETSCLNQKNVIAYSVTHVKLLVSPGGREVSDLENEDHNFDFFPSLG